MSKLVAPKANYHAKIAFHNSILRDKASENFPKVCDGYFSQIQISKLPRTVLSYTRSLKIFFNYLISEVEMFRGKSISDLESSDFQQINTLILTDFMGYLKNYEFNGVIRMNSVRSIRNKMAAVNSFMSYLYRNDFILANPMNKVELPHTEKKVMPYLDSDEITRLLDIVSTGEGLTKGQLATYKKRRLRDIALFTLLLSTGLRVSECVGINLSDIDFRAKTIVVLRKGNSQTYVHFSSIVADALSDYIANGRKWFEPVESDSDALFLSLKHTRLGVRAVEKLVKNYGLLIHSNKVVSPHRLRASYATDIFRKTHDVKLLKDLLNHSSYLNLDVYIHQDEEYLKSVQENYQPGKSNG